MTLHGRPVLVLGSGITVLGVLRILSRDGAEPMVLPDVDGLCRRSRWFRPAPASLTGLSAEQLADRLTVLPRGTVLLPCSDTWARAVARLPEGLRAEYPASIAPPEALDVLVDKCAFAQALETLGLPQPRTRRIESVDDLTALSDQLLAGSFLKPTNSQRFFARFGVKAFWMPDRQRAAEQLALARAEGLTMILQEYVPGPATSHYFIDGFVDRTGAIRALFARRRLRMSPPDFGNSTLMRSVPLQEVGDGPSTLRMLFASLGYRGIFSAEFKRDDRDGRFKLLEINARPWWYVGFAAACGVDVCGMALGDACGDPVPTLEHYRVGRRCVYPYYDLAAFRREHAAGQLGVARWLASWVGATQPVFCWSDPMPALGEVASRLRHRLLG